MYARVVVDMGGSSPLDELTYEIPDELIPKIGVGKAVLVPLGPRQAVGYVVGFQDHADIEKVRPIISDIESPVRLNDEMLALARWISAEYFCPLPRAVIGMLPGVMHQRLQCRIVPSGPPPNLDDFTPSQRSLLSRIIAQGSRRGLAIGSLSAKSRRSSLMADLKALESLGLVRRTWSLVTRSGRPLVLAAVRPVSYCSGTTASSTRLTQSQADALNTIRSLERSITYLDLEREYGISRSVVKALVKKGFLEETQVESRRSPTFAKLQPERPQLTAEQESAVNRITQALDNGCWKVFLIHGVTASGKTEVYIRCIQRACKLRKSSLVLLPEIALTAQLMNIFRTQFGDRVAILHSGLSASERCDEWSRIQHGEADIVLGARSAVFAPLRNLGLVIVDEEHETGYKQDTAPRYHGREVALKRAKDSGAVVILGSATPSVETYYKAERGDLELIEMPSRIESRPMPSVTLVDLRKEYAEAGPTIFSRFLQERISECLARKQQVILLQNRRAYSTFLLCRDCGLVMRCPNCAVALKFYNEARRLSCHHCNFAQPAPTICPNCGGTRIGRFGIGTERVSEEASKRFPNAGVLRMDSDTTSRKGAHAEILNQFREGEADILVGTQMIAKGLDFPNVTLVGVISADTSLNLPEFNAGEKTFQLISQVAGRSGRGTEPGEVVVQTFAPDNYAIVCAVNHDYRSFYLQELENRREAGYPPFASLVNIVARNKVERAAEAILVKLAHMLRTSIASHGVEVSVQGPVPAVLSRLKGEYRWHLVVRSQDKQGMLAALREAFDREPELRRKVVVDVDPVSML